MIRTLAIHKKKREKVNEGLKAGDTLGKKMPGDDEGRFEKYDEIHHTPGMRTW